MKHGKRKTTSLQVAQDGSLTVNSKSRDLTKNGPTQTVHPKKVKKAVSSVGRIKPGKSEDAVYIIGTARACYQRQVSLREIIAYVQNWVRVLDTQFPHIFRHEQTIIAKRTLYPVDFVAYGVMAIIGGFYRLGALNTSVQQAGTPVPNDLKIPIAIAEYIQRLHLVGAPEIMSILTLDSNPSITTGEITYSASAGGTNMSLNQNYVSNFAGTAGFGELWQYGVQTSTSMDPNDLSSYSYTMPTGFLYGPSGSSWRSSGRMEIVQELLVSLGIGLVTFESIPRCTTDPSSFGGSANGAFWNAAKLIWFPAKGGDANLCMVFNPITRDVYFPGTTYVKSVPQLTWTVAGGTYGNSFAGLTPWAGQPVVPTSLDPFMYATQCFMMITMFAPGLQPRVYGKYGYRYCGQIVHDYNRIVSAPINYPAILQRLVSGHMSAIQSPSLVVNQGYVQGLYLYYGAMIVRKVLNSQLEMWSSLGGSTATNAWNIQALIPSQDYLQGNKVPAFVAATLNELAPASVCGVIRVPSIGAGYLVDAWATGNSSTGAKWFLFPKFAGYSPAGSYYASGLIQNPTEANQGDAKTWTFPYFFGASGDPANAATDNSSYIFGVGSTTIGSYTTFPQNWIQYMAVLKITGTDGDGVANTLTAQGPTYDGSTLLSGPDSWANGALLAGRETRLCWQYVGAGKAARSIHKMFVHLVKLNEDRFVEPGIRGIAGGCSMNANVQWTVSFEVNKTSQPVLSAVLSADGIPAAAPALLGAFMDYQDSALVQAMAFFSQTRLNLAYLFASVAYPITPQSTPSGLGNYSSGPFLANMEDITTDDLHDAFAVTCAMPDSDINKYISSHQAKRVTTKGDVEGVYEYGTEFKNHDVGIVEGALINYAKGMELPKPFERFTIQELNDATKEMKFTNHDNPVTAAIKSIHSDDLVDNIDYSASQFFSSAWKGIKTVAPHVIKGALELAPLLL